MVLSVGKQLVREFNLLHRRKLEGCCILGKERHSTPCRRGCIFPKESAISRLDQPTGSKSKQDAACAGANLISLSAFFISDHAHFVAVPVTLFWAALSFLVLFAYPTPEVPTPSFEYHTAFSGVTLGIVSGIQQTYHQFHHENVARLFTPQLKLATFARRMLVGIPTILLVKFCIKALAKWSLPIVAHTLGIPIKSTSYIPVLSQEIPITTSNSGETLVEVKQPGYHQKLFFFSWLSSVDVDTGIRFLQCAALAWSVVALVPSLFSLLRL